ncbi:MAG: hypothetical protein WAV40_01070 [Microgenomates group bacterium]
MPQISKHQLQPEMAELIYEELCSFVSRISTRVGISQFFNDFLTPTEKIMFSKRFMIMVLLMRGHSALHVKNTLFVSNSAVMGVGSWMKNASPTTKKSLEILNKEKDWETFFDSIEEILDKLPPGKYRNWHQAGKEKFNRLKTRQLNNRLK